MDLGGCLDGQRPNTVMLEEERDGTRKDIIS